MSTKNPDLRDLPAYTLIEAARYVRLPSATLRSWIAGRAYPRGKGTATFQPLIHPAQRRPMLISFWNLIEAHVLRSLRTEHGVAIKELRKAIKYAEHTLRIERLLLHKDLWTHAGKVFLSRYSELIELSASGQLAMRKLFEEHLRRVEWDQWQFPVRLYPFMPSEGRREKSIAIDPNIAFGRPVILRKGISTGAITNRIDAGESLAELAEDYGLSQAEIEQAVLYEHAA